MSNWRPFRTFTAKPRSRRIAALALGLAMLSWFGWQHFRSAKSVIVVDGKALVCVSSEQDADEMLSRMKSVPGCKSSEIEFKQNVVIARAPRDAHPVSRGRAMRLVRGAISPVVPKWTIMVDGEPVVAVSSQEKAGEVLELAKLRFGRLAKNLAEEPEFKESVKVDIVSVPPAIFRTSAQDAVELLFAQPRPEKKDAVYEVAKGDIAGTIAERHGISLRDLWTMNPRRNLNRLQIGDKLRIQATRQSKPALTVVVRDLIDRVESVPRPVQHVSSARLYANQSTQLSPGSSGKRRIKVAVIYENGRKVGREIMEEETLIEPTPRRIAVGIKPRPTW